MIHQCHVALIMILMNIHYASACLSLTTWHCIGWQIWWNGDWLDCFGLLGVDLVAVHGHHECDEWDDRDDRCSIHMWEVLRAHNNKDLGVENSGCRENQTSTFIFDKYRVAMTGPVLSLLRLVIIPQYVMTVIVIITTWIWLAYY